VIKIIVDMNLPPRWVPVLKAEGWDAVHWSSVERGADSQA
jgi:predicted nuclease of predicted toxin-antitoxin system